MKQQRLCIFGGTGFVGRRLCAHLAGDGHQITVPTRHLELTREMAVLPQVRRVSCDVHDAEAIEAVIAGHDVVINLVGILNETGHQGGAGFDKAHAQLTANLVAACEKTGVTRFLQMSSLKASEDAPSNYLKSKAKAENSVRESKSLNWTIFQPSVIFGLEDSFTNRFARLMKFGFLPLARPNARFSPVYVDDVVEAFVQSVDKASTYSQTLQLCGPKVYSLRELVDYIRSCTGARGFTMGLPDSLARLQARILEWLPGKPFSMDNYRSLTVNSICEVSGLKTLGIKPKSLESIAPSYLSGEQKNARLSVYRRTAGRNPS